MAKQNAVIPITGTIGNITFYKTQDGIVARQKGGVDPNKIATDPNFQRTRENGAEFARAGKAGKVLRSAFRSVLLNTADPRMISRLTREMLKVIQADKSSSRGLRNVVDGEAELLLGFEFNVNSQLNSTLFASYAPSINRATGELNVTIPAFVPLEKITAPLGATHFRIMSAGAEVDFEKQSSNVKLSSTDQLPWNATATPDINLVNGMAANSPHPLFLVLGIEFFQQVNNSMYSLKNGTFNALSLVGVSGQ